MSPERNESVSLVAPTHPGHAQQCRRALASSSSARSLLSFFNIANFSELKGKESHVEAIVSIRRAAEDISAQDLLDDRIVQVSHL